MDIVEYKMNSQEKAIRGELHMLRLTIVRRHASALRMLLAARDVRGRLKQMERRRDELEAQLSQLLELQ